MNLYNETSYPVNETVIANYCSYLISSLNIKADFSLVLIDSDMMLVYNSEFRHKDYSTDVLTFCEEDQTEYLGDILINIDKVITQAKEYNHSEKRELLFLITHGVLHLLGYDHQTREQEIEMFGLQEELLSNYNVKRGA